MATFTVGLTGGIGSGKSTVAGMFAELGVEVVDADLAAREVVKPPGEALEAIRARHGEAMLMADGSLDRARLRELIFADSAERAWLEQLLHPRIDELLRQQIDSCRSAYCLLVSPLLLETSQQRLADRVLVVDVCRETQLRRASNRDGSDRAAIEAIIGAQFSPAQRLRGADDIINNENARSALPGRVRGLHSRYLAMAQEHA